MISPTIGCAVLFWPDVGHRDAGAQPYPALVAHVWDDRSINVGGFNSGGAPFSACSVKLLQDDDLPPAAGPYAEWGPSQRG
jgi:hypothetical protein